MLLSEPGLRIPNMFEAALDGSFKGLYCEGEDIVQSDPDTQHVAHALEAMECIVVQDLFLTETAKYAHVPSCVPPPDGAPPPDGIAPPGGATFPIGAPGNLSLIT